MEEKNNIMNTYFITKLTNGGSIFGPKLSKEEINYFDSLKTKNPEISFVNLAELYKNLGNSNGKGVKIILSKFSGEGKELISKKYPQAIIEFHKDYYSSRRQQIDEYHALSKDKFAFLKGIPFIGNRKNQK